MIILTTLITSTLITLITLITPTTKAVDSIYLYGLFNSLVKRKVYKPIKHTFYMQKKDLSELTKDEKDILNYLKNNPKDYPNISDISKKLNLSYPTTLKRIEILERLNFVNIMVIGNNRVCLINGDKDGKA